MLHNFRLTDLCHYCEKYVELRRQISQMIKHEYKVQESYNFDEIMKHFKEKAITVKNALNDPPTHCKLLHEILIENYNKYENAVTNFEDFEDFEAINFHKNVVQIQIDTYNVQHKDYKILNNKILIEVDFKQKFVIGLSPRQINSEFYNQLQRSCLGKSKNITLTLLL